MIAESASVVAVLAASSSLRYGADVPGAACSIAR
jgi:hypothetical protein